MNPDQLNESATSSGPIELKAGESTHVLHQQRAADSARSLIDQLPDPHEVKAQAIIAPSTSFTVASTIPPVTPIPAAPVINPLNSTTTSSAPTQTHQAKPVHARPKGNIPSPIKPILIAIATFSLLLFLFKLPVVFSQVKYLVQKPNISLPKAGSVSDTVPAEPSITIPKINIHAPVIYEPSVTEADVQKALINGIVHYGNTPPPGQPGNSVFFGHSSNDWWEPGNYKFVFILLDKLIKGDQFSIDYQGKRYVYQVTSTKVVEPTDLSVLAQTPGSTVTLITCTPPGTSWKRLVVVANQIQPDPSSATTPVVPGSASTPLTALPGKPSSLETQISKGLSGLWRSITGVFSNKPETLQSVPATKP